MWLQPAKIVIILHKLKLFMRNLRISLLLLVLLPVVANAAEGGNVAPSAPKRVVVIDPGHGGPRPGKVHREIVEKNYVLDVSKGVRKKLERKMPSLKVYMTRSCDSAYHEKQSTDNRRRAEFANSVGADLYVSIHANAHPKPTVSGCEVWVLTLNEKLMQQNSSSATSYADEGDFIDVKDIDRSSQGFMVALARQLENEPYSRYFAEECCKNMSKYGLRNLGVKAGTVYTVLYFFEGPGVIVELGYLTNDTDYKYLMSKSAKDDMAEAISDAIVAYFTRLDGASEDGASEGASAEEESPVVEAAAESKELTEGYTIQLISSLTEVDVHDYQFKGYKGLVRPIMGTGRYKYKYCYGSYATAADAKADLAEARKTFKDAYVVRFKDGAIVESK